MDNPGGSRRSFVKSVGELLPELHDEGVTIFFEAHPGDFIEDSFAAVKLLSSSESQHIRYNYCVPHTFNLGHGPREIIQNANGLLGYVHFADTLMPSRIFFSPTHPPKVKPHLHMIPGSGDVDMAEVLEPGQGGLRGLPRRPAFLERRRACEGCQADQGDPDPHARRPRARSRDSSSRSGLSTSLTTRVSSRSGLRRGSSSGQGTRSRGSGPRFSEIPNSS